MHVFCHSLPASCFFALSLHDVSFALHFFTVLQCVIRPFLPCRQFSHASFARLFHSVRFVTRSVLRGLQDNPTLIVSPSRRALLTRTLGALAFVTRFRPVLCYSAFSLLLSAGLIISSSTIGFGINFILCNCLELILNWEISHFRIMAESQEELQKLLSARSNHKSRNIHKNITDAIDRQDRRVKIERLKLNWFLSWRMLSVRLYRETRNYLTWSAKPKTQIQFITLLSNGWMM